MGWIEDKGLQSSLTDLTKRKKPAHRENVLMLFQLELVTYSIRYFVIICKAVDVS